MIYLNNNSRGVYSMIAEQMKSLIEGSSVIREMFEEGKRLAQLHGSEHVYDFSIGNPSVKPPKEVAETMVRLVESTDATELHGYTNNAGYEDVREVIAKDLNEQHNTSYHCNHIIMTVGAAGGLNVILKTLLNPEDEVIVFAPYFGEYKNYVHNYNGKLIVVEPDIPDFQLNLDDFEKKITKKTKAVIINNPNNPTGTVYTEQSIQAFADILRRKQQEYGKDIYVVSDEPYRELVYDGAKVVHLPSYYTNTIVGYSYSKSLSLPGERIGYLLIPGEVSDAEDIIAGATVATRILGFVNAPTIMQKTIAECLHAKVEVETYNRNRELLYESLSRMGYECVKPEGAFYLFVKSPEADDVAFAQKAKNRNVLVVPGSAFGCKGYVRIAYCVAYDVIERSLSSFEQLINEYKNE